MYKLVCDENIEVCVMQDGLLSVRERVREEIVGRSQVHEEFLTARYDTMHLLLLYICDR
jgi:hypothetical protein